MRIFLAPIFAIACNAVLAVTAASAELSVVPRASGGDDGSRFCLTTQDARVAIVQHNLAESSSVMRNAALQVQAEALSGKLCRWNDRYVYEITLLGHDGRVIHVFLNAMDGKTVGVQNGY